MVNGSNTIFGVPQNDTSGVGHNRLLVNVRCQSIDAKVVVDVHVFAHGSRMLNAGRTRAIALGVNGLLNKPDVQTIGFK